MNYTTSKDYDDIIQNVADALGIENWRYKLMCFKDKAQNYFGELIPILLSGDRGEVVENLCLVLKIAPIKDEYRVSGAVTTMFAREIYTYSKILSKFRQILNNFPSSYQFVMPKLFYVREEYCREVIVIENMCTHGYKPYIGSMFLDLKHITLAIQSLARFHALSIIVKEKENSFYKEMEEKCVPFTGQTNKRFMGILLNRLEKAIENFKDTYYEKALVILKMGCVEIIDATVDSVRCLCICHGDIWKENILFLYQDEKPISACLIDYQTTRICSPAFDLLFLLISSTDAALRQNFFENFLYIYHQTFTHMLIEANVELSQYGREILDHDLKVVAPACFIIANTALWLSHGLQQEGHVRSKKQLKTEGDKLQAMIHYKDTVKDILNDLAGYGYLERIIKKIRHVN